MGIFSKKSKDKDKKEGAGKDAQIQDAKKDSIKKESMKDLYEDKGTQKAKDLPAQAGGQDGKMVKEEKKAKKQGNAYRILVKPLVTEKASYLGAQNKYVFEVNKDANKIEITEAVEEVYGVRPVSVNIVRVRGKNVRYGRITGKRKDWKKAIVTLPEGKSINIYEGV